MGKDKAQVAVKEKPVCEVKTHIGCNGSVVRKMKGVKKSDPEFWCCIGCAAVLRRAGVRFKEAR